MVTQLFDVTNSCMRLGTYVGLLRISMGINIKLKKIHGEQPPPPGGYRQRSGECDEETDKQTDTHKTQRFWPSRRWVKSEPRQTWHMVIEDLKNVLAPPKLLGV